MTPSNVQICIRYHHSLPKNGLTPLVTAVNHGLWKCKTKQVFVKIKLNLTDLFDDEVCWFVLEDTQLIFGLLELRSVVIEIKYSDANIDSCSQRFQPSIRTHHHHIGPPLNLRTQKYLSTPYKTNITSNTLSIYSNAQCFSPLLPSVPLEPH